MPCTASCSLILYGLDAVNAYVNDVSLLYSHCHLRLNKLPVFLGLHGSIARKNLLSKDVNRDLSVTLKFMCNNWLNVHDVHENVGWVLMLLFRVFDFDFDSLDLILQKEVSLSSK